MLNVKSVNSMMLNLERIDLEFEKTLDKFIKLGIFIYQNTKELQEEVIDYDEIYQFNIINEDGEDFDFWLELHEGKISYNKGITKIPTLQITITKDLLKKFFSGEMKGDDAYMKGLIKMKGSLAVGLKFRNAYRFVFEYMNKKFDINE